MSILVSLKKFRLIIPAGVAALVFALTGTGQAWAVLNTSGWLANFISTGVPLQSPEGYQEARNGGYLFQAWESDSQPGVLWAAIGTNGTGEPVRVTLPSGEAMRGYPAVSPSNNQSFQIAFTATDNRIWRATFTGTQTGAYGNLSGLRWSDTGQLSYYPPALAQDGTGSTITGMTWIAANSTRNVLFATYDSSRGTWTNGADLGGASSYGPAVTFNNGQYVVAHTGDDGQVYIAHGDGGAANWSPWISTGANRFVGGPAIAAVGDAIELSATDANGYVWLMLLNPQIQITQGWTRSTFQTRGHTNLSANTTNNNIYEIATGEDQYNNGDNLHFRDPVYYWPGYQPK